MGVTSSKSKVVADKIIESVSAVASKTTQNCTSITTLQQEYGYINTGFQFWVSNEVTQMSKVDFKCIMESSKEVSLQNDIFESIKQVSESEGSGIIMAAFGSTNASAETNLKTIIKNEINMEKIQNTYNKLNAQQRTTLLNAGIQIFSTTRVKQGSDLFIESVLSEIENSSILNKIKTKIDQDSGASMDSPYQAFVDMLNSVMWMIVGVTALVLISIIGLIAWMVMGNNNNDSNDNDSNGSNDDSNDSIRVKVSNIIDEPPAYSINDSLQTQLEPTPVELQENKKQNELVALL